MLAVVPTLLEKSRCQTQAVTSFTLCKAIVAMASKQSNNSSVSMPFKHCGKRFVCRFGPKMPQVSASGN